MRILLAPRRHEESARGLYRRSGIHLHHCTDVTLPRRLIFSCCDYNSLYNRRGDPLGESQIS